MVISNNLVAIDIEYEIKDEKLLSCVLSLDRKFISINEEFIEVSGFSKEELLNMTCLNIKHPHVPHTIYKVIFEELSKGQKTKNILKNFRKGGRHYWVVSEGTPIYDTVNQLKEFHFKQTTISSEKIEKIDNLYKKLVEYEKNQYIKNPEIMLQHFLKDEHIDSLAALYEEALVKDNFFSKLKKWF